MTQEQLIKLLIILATIFLSVAVYYWRMYKDYKDKYERGQETLYANLQSYKLSEQNIKAQYEHI